MQKEKRRFWSSAPGIITALTGVLTGTVALVTLLVQFGVLDSSKSPGSSAAESSGAGSEVPSFSVSPLAVNLDQLLAKEAKVDVKNTGDVAMSVRAPTVRGGDASQFAASDVSCTAAKVEPGEACQMSVSFTPKGNGRFSATLLVAVEGASAPVEVALRASALL